MAPLICHFLIGLPASGKSTFARRLQEMIPNTAIVSTDTAREKLFDDESIQGDWAKEVEPEILKQIQNAISSGKPVIYDATNIRRDWRMGMLMKIEEKLQEIDAPQVYWVAWHLQTPVETCKEWNQKRDRHVPDEVIEEFNKSLEKFPIETGEGFIKLFQLSPPEYYVSIKRKEKLPSGSRHKTKTVIEKYDIPRLFAEELAVDRLIASLQSKQNQQGKGQWHQYSKLLDFERLIYLISLILNNPGIESIESICELMQNKYGKIYSSQKEISRDIQWLNENYFTHEYAKDYKNIYLEILPDISLDDYIFCHCFSKKKSFIRLLEVIRFLCHSPVFIANKNDIIENVEWEIEENCLDNQIKNNLYESLEEIQKKLLDEEFRKLEKSKEKAKIKLNKQEINRFEAKIDNLKKTQEVSFPLRYVLAFKMLLKNIDITGEQKGNIFYKSGVEIAKEIQYFGHNFRKDVQQHLKKYQILSDKTMDKGYFIGTALFSKMELEDIYERMILPHKDYVDELVADEIYSQVESRLGSKAIDIQKREPIRKIGISSIVDYEFLPGDSLARKDNLQIIENAIAHKNKLKLSYLKGSGKHIDIKEQHQDFEAYPLLILFHNIAWYLGLEYADGEKQGLYKFERLDRLKLLKQFENEGDLTKDKKFSQSIKNINKLYNACPGIFLGNKDLQQKWLNNKAIAKTKIELWFTNEIYPFILEGMKRYKGIQMTDPRSNPQLDIPKIYTLQTYYENLKFELPKTDLSEEDLREKQKGLKLEKIFQLEKTNDLNFPNKFTVNFPTWSIQDYDFLRWILGFGGAVKVKQPKELIAKIDNLANSICKNYTS